MKKEVGLLMALKNKNKVDVELTLSQKKKTV